MWPITGSTAERRRSWRRIATIGDDAARLDEAPIDRAGEPAERVLGVDERVERSPKEIALPTVGPLPWLHGCSPARRECTQRGNHASPARPSRSTRFARFSAKRPEKLQQPDRRPRQKALWVGGL
jgi:hypothetical protein